MVKVQARRSGPLEHEGVALGNIHRQANGRKAIAYWLGFLRGVLASNRIEIHEKAPLRTEAETFLEAFQDSSVGDLIHDLDRLWNDDGDGLRSAVERAVEARTQDFTVETVKDEVNEFYGFCAGIACDNVITPAEIEALIGRVQKSKALSGEARISRLERMATRAIADGRITPDESEDICGWISRLVGDSATDTGVATFGNVGVMDGALDDHRHIQFDGRMFVLTGKFFLGPRKALAGLIADRGGSWKNAVCGQTDYLAVAAAASRDWKHSHEGTKIIRVMELRDQGGRPHLVQEPTLAAALDLVA